MTRLEFSKYNSDELVYLFLINLSPGVSFMLNETKITVGKINLDGSMRWIVNGISKRVYCTNGVYYGYNGKARKLDWFIQYLRDIEGIIIVDLLNINNPFHKFSDISKFFINDVE